MSFFFYELSSLSDTLCTQYHTFHTILYLLFFSLCQSSCDTALYFKWYTFSMAEKIVKIAVI